ncbi:MAG: hypothetical protein A2508_10495 [Candidatus Lambdaproteobacteria bacterium RIFOXYD12_FULL_49_8]|uniref:Histidine kinase/HSP90-like ATPase domain-containing protein n=1 Tax=Candidatus Lambdaproteobacteria bacterium RIFOXYD2_FULL_50_16 TaxID=1817772 RepID=A0A1F6GES8_9PROT|nr:MAG: hypothetical protein A2527_03380 [Candidatus Lambdaproteobacteria bacterium RIFOXYD2_FULL_50_16]OGG97860.1 MAG: hypothetical protein A2508_10495 [Candidatus Lambdaproteobacteria bacterium RIFOXYD12_FULL_49_8]
MFTHLKGISETRYKMPLKLLEVKKRFTKKGAFFGFSGPLNQEQLVRIGAILRRQMAEEKASSGQIMKVYSIVVETVQNVIRYSAKTTPDEDPLGTLWIGRHEQGFFVACGNLVSTHKASALKIHLAELMALSPEELKTHFKKESKKPISKDQGSGLGLIEIVRLAAKPPEIEFVPLDQELSFFSINTFIQ